ncbi:hypothetical protein B0H63DRAFT_490052 [Podospora didyma]|uniref:Uncharacterized protein n=1 Tax=Podospora didyma TaxID=330526 RepID=A0AAE0K1G2_9PEZI|nr:hypothetical protein B0H63DRAFT_490052 [Podospora didyma]
MELSDTNSTPPSDTEAFSATNGKKDKKTRKENKKQEMEQKKQDKMVKKSKTKDGKDTDDNDNKDAIQDGKQEKNSVFKKLFVWLFKSKKKPSNGEEGDINSNHEDRDLEAGPNDVTASSSKPAKQSKGKKAKMTDPQTTDSNTEYPAIAGPSSRDADPTDPDSVDPDVIDGKGRKSKDKKLKDKIPEDQRPDSDDLRGVEIIDETANKPQNRGFWASIFGRKYKDQVPKDQTPKDKNSKATDLAADDSSTDKPKERGFWANVFGSKSKGKNKTTNDPTAEEIEMQNLGVDNTAPTSKNKKDRKAKDAEITKDAKSAKTPKSKDHKDGVEPEKRSWVGQLFSRKPNRNSKTRMETEDIEMGNMKSVNDAGTESSKVDGLGRKDKKGKIAKDMDAKTKETKGKEPRDRGKKTKGLDREDREETAMDGMAVDSKKKHWWSRKARVQKEIKDKQKHWWSRKSKGQDTNPIEEDKKAGKRRWRFFSRKNKTTKVKTPKDKSRKSRDATARKGERRWYLLGRRRKVSESGIIVQPISEEAQSRVPAASKQTTYTQMPRAPKRTVGASTRSPSPPQPTTAMPQRKPVPNKQGQSQQAPAIEQPFMMPEAAIPAGPKRTMPNMTSTRPPYSQDTEPLNTFNKWTPGAAAVRTVKLPNGQRRGAKY